MEIKTLQKLISRASTGSGIYIFTGSGNKKLYIGKASNLKVRLSSYLKTADHRILKMLSMTTGIRTVETGSEIRALIAESQYIKKYKPAFNIMLRDDKQFGFVGFTHSTSSRQAEECPRVFITHQPHPRLQASKIISWQADFIGPFTDVGALKATLRYLRRTFPYCTCKKPHNNFCLNYHIGKCPGFCCLKDRKQRANSRWQIEYRRNIKVIKNILNGKKTSLLKRLEREMIKLGKSERFHEAIELRGKIEKIKRVFENAKIIQKHLHSHIMIYGNGGVLEEMKKIFRLPKLPIRIEGYDIANIQGKYAVGAMVVFTDGKPRKNEYRKFKIYTKNTPNDTAMLKEVLIRRFLHREWPTPDLMLVDGGKQQLQAAEAIASSKLKNLNSTQIPIIALTKNKKRRGNKIFVAGKKTEIRLSRIPVSVKNILLQIDMEVHRFAISYYRKLHGNVLGLGK